MQKIKLFDQISSFFTGSSCSISSNLIYLTFNNEIKTLNLNGEIKTISTFDESLITCLITSEHLVITATENINYFTKEGKKVYSRKSPHQAPILSMDAHLNLLATGSADGDLYIWDINTHEATHRFKGNSIGILFNSKSLQYY